MATAKLNPIINSIHGRTGTIVFYRRHGRTFIRMHVIPRNPDTRAQNAVRRAFAGAVKSWKSLTLEQKYKFNRKARNLNMSGYNLYISVYMKTRVSPQRNDFFIKTFREHLTSYSLQLRFKAVYKQVQGNVLNNTLPDYNKRL